MKLIDRQFIVRILQRKMKREIEYIYIYIQLLKMNFMLRNRKKKIFFSHHEVNEK